MKFKGTKTEWEVVEHNWRETSIYSNGKTICSFELDDIEEEDLTKNDLSEEENAYNIQLIKHSKEMLQMLQWFVENFEGVFHEGTETDNKVKEAKQLIKQATEL